MRAATVSSVAPPVACSPGSARQQKRAFSAAGTLPVQQRPSVVRNSTESPVGLPAARRPPAVPTTVQVSRVQQFLDSARRSRSDDRSEHSPYSPVRPPQSTARSGSAHSPLPPKSSDLRPPRRKVYTGQNQSPELCEATRAVSSDSRRPPLSSFGFAGLSGERNGDEQAENSAKNATGNMTPSKTAPAQSPSPHSGDRASIGAGSPELRTEADAGEGGQRVRRGSRPHETALQFSLVEPLQGAGELILPWWLINSSATAAGKSGGSSRSKACEEGASSRSRGNGRDVQPSPALFEDIDFTDGVCGWDDDGRVVPHRKFDDSQKEAHLQSHCRRVRGGEWLLTGHDELICPEALASIQLDTSVPSGPREGPGISELAFDFERRTECPVCADEWNKAAIRLREAGLISSPCLEANRKNLSSLVSPQRRRVSATPQMHSVKCVYWWFQHSLAEGARDTRFPTANRGKEVELYFGAPVSAFPPPMADVVQHWKSVRKSENSQRTKST